MLAKTQRRCSSIVPFHSHEPVVFGFYEFVGRDPHGTQCTTSELDTHKRVLYKKIYKYRFEGGAYCKLANLKYIIVYKYLSTREVASKLQTCTFYLIMEEIYSISDNRIRTKHRQSEKKTSSHVSTFPIRTSQ